MWKSHMHNVKLLVISYHSSCLICSSDIVQVLTFGGYWLKKNPISTFLFFMYIWSCLLSIAKTKLGNFFAHESKFWTQGIETMCRIKVIEKMWEKSKISLLHCELFLPKESLLWKLKDHCPNNPMEMFLSL
jgi:hypothetical protein